MEKLITQFPQNLIEAIQIAKNSNITKVDKLFTNIVFCGMGGSGIGGILVSKWLNQNLSLPFEVVQDYNLPSYVNENTLLIASSYSGSTEETIFCVEEGILKGATIIGITSGGKLLEICKSNNFQFITFEGGAPPRSALGYSIVQILYVLDVFGLSNRKTYFDELTNISQILQQHQNVIKIEASKIADLICQSVVHIYAESKYEGVCIRFVQQLNENSKMLCSYNVIPEMNHNEIVGWGTEGNENAVLFIDSSDLHLRNKVRFDYTKKLLESKTNKTHSITPQGDTFIEKSLYYIHLLDWVSFYLSNINNVDIMDINVIDNLKNELSSIKNS